jgi:hypothetical protein
VWKLTVALVLCVIAQAEIRSTSICIEDRTSLNPYIRKAFDAELRRLVEEQFGSFSLEECSPSTVVVVVAAHPPARYATALGLAYRGRVGVLPQLRVYTQPVLRLLGEHASAAQLGRALARVAAHEIGHYFLQQLHHNHEGLMTASLDRTRLKN